ncbi:MAG: YqeG family HAD IIIA-type phosphatase [Defluviitaleaceae bacterium]|nr:YqeG family HAD IIIA-type phosphatase [Defluviitaleaceae bacterium]
MGKLKPDYYLDTVFQIPYEELWKNKIRGLIFDIDNTIAPYEEAEPSAKVTSLFARLKRMGFQICLLTNNTNKRLECFSKPLEIYGIANALKPSRRGMKKAMKLMGTKAAHTAIVGDQLFTDVWAGKNTGAMTVLVKPIADKDFVTVRLKRLLEGRLLKRYYATP